jgi:uncharacterized membrane protein
MTYTFIGVDGQEYGPVTEEQARQWIAEGRLNAQSMAKAESDAAFRPLSAMPEFEGAFPPKAPAPAGPPPPASAADLLARDHNVAIGDCVERGWQLVKSNFWPTVGVTFLVLLVIGAINQIFGLFTRPAINGMIQQHQFSAGGILIVFVVSIIGAPVYTVFIAGLYMYFLKLIRGQSPTVGDAFSGFGPSLGQLILLGLVQSVLILVAYAFCVLPGLYLNVAWYFAIPLVIDRQIGFWDAMELSRKMVTKHWFAFFGLFIVCGLVAGAGVLACCVGLFVTIPISLAALAYAYESVFSGAQLR